MKPQHIVLIVGTRPEAIKLAPVVLAARGQPDRWRCTIVGTGQQREMLPQALAEFGLAVDYDLGVMQANQSLAGLTARLLDALDPLLRDLAPDWVFVQGDTTSAMAGALAAFYRRIRVAHVEAGLRTYDRFAPYPEEVNRRIVTTVADCHFAVTPRGRQNLLNEGVPEHAIHVVGNTGIDALLWIRDQLGSSLPGAPESLIQALTHRSLILVTGHRRENFDHGIQQICLALREIAARFPETVVLYPVHLNPNIQEPVQRILSGQPRIILLDPLPYRLFVALMSRATLILTDSGGVQEEAPSLGKPVLVMRETTERPEGVEAGNALLVGADRARILATVAKLLHDPTLYKAMAHVTNPYGDGHAAGRILDLVLRSG